MRAEDVRREVVVAELEPRVLAERTQRPERVKRLVPDAITRRVVEDPRKPVDDGVDVGGHEKAPELVIVGGVRDDGQTALRQDGVETGRELGSAGAAGEHDDVQRNMSSAAGRSRSRPLPLRSPGSSPRTMTAGV